jgi:hypothetical protein
MSGFDQFDRRMAASIDRVMGEGIVWRPQVVRPGGRYTESDDMATASTKPDPSRPVRPGLRGVPTWRPDVMNAGIMPAEGGVVGFQCVVDFELDQFRVPDSDPENPEYAVPQRFDLLELEEEYEGNKIVQIVRSGDDGSERLFFYCQPQDS